MPKKATNPQNLKPCKKGETHNPAGYSRKARARVAARRRIEEGVRDCINGTVSDMMVAAKFLEIGLSCDIDELKRLLAHHTVPPGVKRLLKEAVEDPKAYIQLFQMVLGALEKMGDLPHKAEAAAEQPKPKTDEEVAEALDRLKEIIRNV